MSVLKYFVWNAMIFGTLVAGYYLGATDTAGTIIGIFYGIAIPLYIISVLSSGTEKFKEVIKKHKFKTWIYIFEPLYPILAANFGYKKIALCMFVELCCTAYLHITKVMLEKEDKKEAAK